ncbi:MAG: serine/threonine-protein kinase [Fimbriiglobus sp.]
MTGQRLGDWQIGFEHGQGPLATVYDATDVTQPDRVAVVKIFHHPELLRPEFLAKFPAEVLSLHRLNHINIAKYYEAGVHDGRAWLAMEKMEGVDLVTKLRSSSKPGEPGLPWAEQAISVAVQVGRALRHGHHRSVLHRDVKPTNLFLQADGTVKLTDFGLAKYLPVPLMNLPAEPTGTLGFLAPEHFNGRPATRKSDLYSYGCLLYMLMTGRPPYMASTAAEFTKKHCYTLPDRPGLIVPDLPPDLDDLICALLNKDPNRRPPSAALVLEEFQQIRAKADRKGRKVLWPSDAPDTSADIVLPEIGPDDTETDSETTESRPLMSRPAVVIPLCLGFVAVVLALIFWPNRSAQQLHDAATKLMQSSNPDDWDTAWNDHWTPLKEHYPDEFQADYEAAKAKIKDYRELQQALKQLQQAPPASEAERTYRRGLKLAELGEWNAARKCWGLVMTIHTGTESEARWVNAAKQALEASAKVAPPNRPTNSNLDALLARLQTLRREGNNAAATELQSALEDCYRDEPAILELIRRQ